MNFTDALNLSGLAPLMFGKFTPECAGLIRQVADLENVDATVLAVTWFNESTFGMYPMPQTNHQPLNILKWDISTVQINLGWWIKSIMIGEFSAKGLTFEEIFGTEFFDENGKPAPFNGSPLASLRMSARKLFAHNKGNREEMAVAYTGPDHKEARRKSWQQYSPLFDIFFAHYTPETNGIPG